jgi:four helix bundle protein
MKENHKTNPNKRVYDLEARLIKFSLMIIKLVEMLPSGQSARLIGSQLLRSGTSPALNYAEAQVAESKADFIHKMSISLKELKESQVAILIIKGKSLVNDSQYVIDCCNECSELVAIFIASVRTARKNAQSRS